MSISENLVWEFQNVFKTPFITDNFITGLTGRPHLDIFKFDDWLHEQKGYTEEEHGSINDFVKLKYGVDAVNLIRKLI